MGKKIVVKVGSEAILTTTVALNADFILADDVARLKSSVSEGKNGKKFTMGDRQSGRVEVTRKMGGSWKAKGLDGKVEGISFSIPSDGFGSKITIDDAVHEMARQLAFLTADVGDVSKRIESKYGIGVNPDDLAELIHAEIELNGCTREITSPELG